MNYRSLTITCRIWGCSTIKVFLITAYCITFIVEQPQILQVIVQLRVKLSLDTCYTCNRVHFKLPKFNVAEKYIQCHSNI